jgi:hypothetical protein
MELTMSIETMNRVIRRAVVEPAFQQLLLREAATALGEYDLSAAEMAMLTGLTPETFDALAGELDHRISQSVIWGTKTGGSDKPPVGG